MVEIFRKKGISSFKVYCVYDCMPDFAFTVSYAAYKCILTQFSGKRAFQDSKNVLVLSGILGNQNKKFTDTMDSVITHSGPLQKSSSFHNLKNVT
jgi:hypothetical protein